MSISNRIHQLEEVLAAGARMIVVSHPSDMTNDELEHFLETRGISTRTDDLVVSLKRLGDAHPKPWVMIDGSPA